MAAPNIRVNNVSAAGASQATAALLSSTAGCAICTGAGGVLLPYMPSGSQYTIVNGNAGGGSTINIYPPVGGSIDGGTVNVFVVSLAGTSQQYISKDGLNWVTISTGSTLNPNTFSYNVVAQTADKILTAADSGTIFASAGAPFTLTMPTPTIPGYTIGAIFSATVGGNITVSTGVPNLRGTAIAGDATAVGCLNGTSQSTITLSGLGQLQIIGGVDSRYYVFANVVDHTTLTGT